jgi:hypothetical protein
VQQSFAQLRLIAVENQLTIAIQRNTRAGVIFHADFTLLIAYFIGHVISQFFLLFIINCFAALFGCGVGIPILQSTLDLITGITARYRTRYCRYIPAATATKLVTQHPTCHCT